jgi:hypothetical protein
LNYLPGINLKRNDRPIRRAIGGTLLMPPPLLSTMLRVS